jgi:hypothetical protein
MIGQVLENPFATPFRVSLGALVSVLALLLCVFISPLVVIVLLVGATSLWFVLRKPVSTLGIVLAFMPFDFMAIALGKFYGLPHMTLISVCDKELVLLLLAFLLWRRNGFKAAAPDWFLLAFFVLALVRTIFDGSLVNLALDLDFVIAYAIGRVAVLSTQQEEVWAKCAVWIAAVLSVLGMGEVFIFGEGPRTLLYLAIDSETEGGALTASFHGTGLTGLREAATMVGPNGFGALCMIALVIWWVYFRNPLPAVLVVAGLICSVTRSAWLGAAAAVVLLAVLMRQWKRFLSYTAVAVGLFALSIPVLGLSDYLFFTKTGQDSSAEVHRDQIVDGLKYDVEHPFGSGNGKLSPMALKQEENATVFETTYPEIAAEYGIAPALAFVGFLLSAFYVVLRERSRLAYVALGILVGIGVVMIFTLPLIDRRLVCWALFPVGLAVRSAFANTATAGSLGADAS